MSYMACCLVLLKPYIRHVTPLSPQNPAYRTQLANEVNSRRINDEYNVFEGIFQSTIFMAIWLLCVGLQVSANCHYRSQLACDCLIGSIRKKVGPLPPCVHSSLYSVSCLARACAGTGKY